MKVAVVLVLEAVVAVVAAFSVDGAAERIVLYAAAGGGVLWFGAKFARLCRLTGRLLRRTIEAVEAFEELPRWRDETDGRLSALESEVALNHNGIRAIIRELGIEDAVRRMPGDVW